MGDQNTNLLNLQCLIRNNESSVTNLKIHEIQEYAQKYDTRTNIIFTNKQHQTTVWELMCASVKNMNIIKPLCLCFDLGKKRCKCILNVLRSRHNLKNQQLSNIRKIIQGVPEKTKIVMRAEYNNESMKKLLKNIRYYLPNIVLQLMLFTKSPVDQLEIQRFVQEYFRNAPVTMLNLD